jgi:hypothetical protein
VPPRPPLRGLITAAPTAPAAKLAEGEVVACEGSREVFEAYPTAELYRSYCHGESTILVGATLLE